MTARHSTTPPDDLTDLDLDHLALESLNPHERVSLLLGEAHDALGEHKALTLSGLDALDVIAPVARRAAHMFGLWADAVEVVARLDREQAEVEAQRAQERRAARQEERRRERAARAAQEALEAAQSDSEADPASSALAAADPELDSASPLVRDSIERIRQLTSGQ